MTFNQMQNQNCIPHLEWEFSDLPVLFSQLKFSQQNWGYDHTAEIKVWRSENFRLKAEIVGKIKVTDLKKLDENRFIEEGNILKDQIITGVDSSNNSVEIHGCLLIGHHYDSRSFKPDGVLVRASLLLESLQMEFAKPTQTLIRMEWFYCSNISPFFFETTYRNKNLPKKKLRIGLDAEWTEIESLPGSRSKDYVYVKTPDIEFIVAEVPKGVLQTGRHGVCFEFRTGLEKVDNDLLEGIQSFVSFLLGCRLQHIGRSSIDNEVLQAVILESPRGEYPPNPMPPIRFNFKYQWGDFGWLLNQFLPKYLELRKVLPLDDALYNYWIARETPLGVNLPILASAVESIAAQYLKTVKDYKLEHMPREVYLDLIKEERDTLSSKFSKIEGGDIVLGKILGSFRKGAAEKLKDFFRMLNLSLSKKEKKAIALRNKMAHSSVDYKKIEDAHTDVILSRAYEVLFHRVILKLLGYDGYYIDYTTKDCPVIHIDRNGDEN